MADWAKPTVLDLYADVLDYLTAKDVDAYSLAESPTTPPVGALRYVRASNKFQEWDGAAWQEKTVSVAGGGTGSTTASGARTALGLGTLSVQNANAIAVTGGTLAGVTAFAFSCDLLPDADGTRDLGSNAKKVDTIYIKNGLLLPVGADKWVAS